MPTELVNIVDDKNLTNNIPNQLKINPSGSIEINDITQLIPEKYDYIFLTYVTSGNGIGEIETVTYRDGGSGGAIVATLTLAYDASNRLNEVTRT